ncbi:MAG TPA: thioredoxin domain-containing protein [Alphaproteobacteria bacterium]|nr:thioredoxin domain-containing protein [Alphaproteobacteria bacterium]
MAPPPSGNLLKHETSPYLLQHADNPVHWRAWNEAALAEARTSGKPILLSVGYAACHWCHVMAHESFEDEVTAALMNELFVNIKVDREERPDLDAIYQTALAMMGEQGGWPLTMFLTPEGAPFWGGTYFPPSARYGRPGFPDLLRGIAEAYRGKPDQVRQNVEALTGALNRRAGGDAGGGVPIATIDKVAARLAQEVDTIHGGIGGAPKFPQCSVFALLWRAHRRAAADPGGGDFRRAVTLTLDRMCQGGIYDHLGGGFARYSTDARWLAPHFEKMLYDNAQMIDLLTLVWQETKSPLYAARIAETIGWLMREMTAEDDAFAATLDADSEGEEGKFYVWRADEIAALLGVDTDFFADAYDVTPEGNWEGHTILNRSKRMLLGDAAHESRLAKCRDVLFAARAQRIAPGRDDKVLADWNGMMIAALARAGFVFDRPEWLARAQAAFAGAAALLDRDGRLAHSYRAGRRQDVAMLDDYAQMARAALTLFEITGEDACLARAQAWVAMADAHYWDDAAGGYFFTADDAPGLIARTKHAHDNATPSGNGVMAEVLTRLHLLTGESRHRDRAEAVIGAFSGELAKNFFPLSTLLNAAELMTRPLQVAICGPREAPATVALLRATATSASLPNLVLSVVAPDADLPPSHPAHGKGMIGAKPAVYVCDGPVCSPPFTDPAALTEDLKRR